MTSEEIKAAIHRVGNTMGHTIDEVIEALCNRPVNGCILRGKLIELLRQADPDTHIKRPLDADGVPIHIGDKVESDHREDGTVVGIEYYKGVGVLIAVRSRNWDTPSWCDPKEYRHHHEPTVSEILDELEGMRGTGDYESVVTRAAELAGTLRELLADE